MTNQEIINVGQQIHDETHVGANTSERVGGVIQGIGENLKEHSDLLYDVSPKETVTTPTYENGIMSTTGSLVSNSSYGIVRPIELANGETIKLNLGNPLYHGYNVATLFRCDSTGTFIETLITGSGTSSESWTNTTGDTVYVGISAYRSQLGYIISKDIKSSFELIDEEIGDNMNYSFDVAAGTTTPTTEKMDVDIASGDIFYLKVSDTTGDGNAYELYFQYDGQSSGTGMGSVLSGTAYKYTASQKIDKIYLWKRAVSTNKTVRIDVWTGLLGQINLIGSNLPQNIDANAENITTLTNSLTYLQNKSDELETKLSGHMLVPFEGKGANSVNKTIITIIGHKYRFVYPTNWTVSDSAIVSDNVVFVLRTTADDSTYTDVNATKIFKKYFSSKGAYVEYTATTVKTNIWLRADNGNYIEFDVIDLTAENIAANAASIANNTESIANNTESIANNTEIIKDSLKAINILGSARFSTNQNEVATSAVFIHDQSLLIGKTIIGLLVNVQKAGTAVLCKCTNYRVAQTPIIETLKTFDVKQGINYLFLDTPITLQDGEAFGWSAASTAAYYKGGYDSSYNKGYYYYNNGWQKSGADLSMAILTNDLSKLMEELGPDSTARTQASVGQINSQWPNSPFQAHLFIDKIGSNSDVLIPSQSVFDIDVAYRLGFKVFELNTQITADNNGVCMHGVGGALGYQVTDLNGEFHPEVKFADLNLAQLQSNYVYRSSMAKYRVPITDIDTALRELKKRSMIPFTSGTINANVLSKIQSVFGNNYIAYSGSRNTVGGGVPICNYSGISTKAEIISQCEIIGSPYIHSFSHAAIMAIYKSNASEYSGTDMTEKTDTELITYFNSLSESQKIELINLNKEWFRDVFYEIHKRNCYVSWAPCYEFEGTNQLFLSLGVDCTGGSDKHVPDFSCGNICNYSALFDFSEFSHNGSEQDGVLTLTAGQSITVNGSTQELAKGSLHVRYTGTANVSIGHKGAADIINDGKETMVFTSYFLNAIPTFVITAVTTIKITEISWRASKC